MVVKRGTAIDCKTSEKWYVTRKGWLLDTGTDNIVDIQHIFIQAASECRQTFEKWNEKTDEKDETKNAFLERNNVWCLGW